MSELGAVDSPFQLIMNVFGFMGLGVVVLLFAPVFHRQMERRWYATIAFLLLVVAGLFNSIYMISTMTTLQVLVPDRLRGRVMGIYGMTWNIMPLGGMQAGAIANFISAPVAVSIGGAAVVAFASIFASANRNVRRLGPHDRERTARAT